jgi:hypothetical protein
MKNAHENEDDTMPELTSAELDTVKSATSNTSTIDHLTEDEPIQGQLFVCLSFLSPEGIKNCSLRGVKFRGAFPTYETATSMLQNYKNKIHYLIFL